MTPLFLLLLLLLPSPSSEIPIDPIDDVPYNTSLAETAHDKLAEYGLPKGLLPSPVSSFSLDPSTGLLLVRLPPSPSSCRVPFLLFSPEIRARLSRGRLSLLSGVRARWLFLWLPLTSVLADPSRSSVSLRSGPLSRVLPARAFRAIPRCAGARPYAVNDVDLPCGGYGSPSDED